MCVIIVSAGMQKWSVISLGDREVIGNKLRWSAGDQQVIVGDRGDRKGENWFPTTNISHLAITFISQINSLDYLDVDVG